MIQQFEFSRLKYLKYYITIYLHVSDAQCDPDIQNHQNQIQNQYKRIEIYTKSIQSPYAHPCKFNAKSYEIVTRKIDTKPIRNPYENPQLCVFQMPQDQFHTFLADFAIRVEKIEEIHINSIIGMLFSCHNAYFTDFQ